MALQYKDSHVNALKDGIVEDKSHQRLPEMTYGASGGYFNNNFLTNCLQSRIHDNECPTLVRRCLTLRIRDCLAHCNIVAGIAVSNCSLH